MVGHQATDMTHRKTELLTDIALQEREVSVLHPEGHAPQVGFHHAWQHEAAADGAPQLARPQHGGPPAAGPPGGLLLRDPPPDPPAGDPDSWRQQVIATMLYQQHAFDLHLLHSTSASVATAILADMYVHPIVRTVYLVAA